jgi:hypothetical protein
MTILIIRKLRRKSITFEEGTSPIFRDQLSVAIVLFTGICSQEKSSSTVKAGGWNSSYRLMVLAGEDVIDLSYGSMNVGALDNPLHARLPAANPVPHHCRGLSVR